MYKDSVGQWNPFFGCRFECLYCKPSFQKQAKRRGNKCRQCYHYEPHEHPKRLETYLPRTPKGKFIFTCASADISFCKKRFLKKILARITEKSDRTFLIQSKNPKTFGRVTFPDNVILGTTLETNRDAVYKQAKISKAPPPSQRFKDFLNIQHARKMVTIEPVMEFDTEVMLDWIKQLKPVKVWIGYDSKKNHLVEPELSKVEVLGEAIKELGIEVKYKTMREAVSVNDVSSKVKSQSKKGKMNMSKTTKGPRLTAEQKTKLSESYAKTKNIAKSATELNIKYQQAYNFLSKQKKTPKAIKTIKPAATTGKAKTAEEIYADIEQMEQDLLTLRKQLGAQLKVEDAKRKKFKKAARG